ncbi:tRNA pseudouridine(38-40) synthase TruA [Arthrobacter roseus]|nr:tRNA pseudouridine synthase A [Arthrobacter roseus]
MAYDGSPFCGWAKQPGLLTVQGCLEEGLETLFRRPVRLTVAGRTDSGVHARGQVAHCDLTANEWASVARGKELSPADALRRRLQGVLSMILGPVTGAVEILDVETAPEGFDARFSALWRRYEYRIADRAENRDPLLRGLTLWHGEALDEAQMNAGAERLLGLQDFKAYCKPREGATTIRELQRFDFSRDSDGVLVATVRADAFCHNMVRCLVGAALPVGAGSHRPERMYERLVSGVRSSQSVFAPPHPLVLQEIGYPPGEELAVRAALTRTRRKTLG